MTKLIEVQDTLLRNDRRPLRVPKRDEDDNVMWEDKASRVMDMKAATTIDFLRFFMLSMPKEITTKGEDSALAQAIWNDIFNAEEMVVRRNERTTKRRNGGKPDPAVEELDEGDPELTAAMRSKLDPNKAYVIMRDGHYRWFRRKMDHKMPLSKEEKDASIGESTYLETLIVPHHLSGRAISMQLMDVDERKAAEAEAEPEGD